MIEKCDKFEALFTFSDENTLMEHIRHCEACKLEYERMHNVSELIKEVKPYYNGRHFYALRAACILLAFMAGCVTFMITDVNCGIIDNIKYGRQLTAEDLGFRTDEYGLIMVGNE